MIEYVILAVAAAVFLLVVFGLGLVVLLKFARSGLSRVSSRVAAGPRAAKGRGVTLADLVEQHVNIAEAEAKAAKRKADLDAKLAGLLSDPKDEGSN
jgi:hypothetical protein